MDKKWAQSLLSREQHILFPVTLDDIVPANHAIRILDAILDTCDWNQWEIHYNGHRGQPPIHPRLMAGCILYGLLRSIRSSRGLEDATRERKDFMWFLEGRVIDHSTFASFRTAFSKELKDLHRQIARKICELTQAAFDELVLDGTRERANSDRHGARSAQTIEQMIKSIVATLDGKLDEMARADQASCPAPGRQIDAFDQEPAAPEQTDMPRQLLAAAPQTDCAKTAGEMARLQHEIEQLRAKAKQLQKALDAARERDEIKKKIAGKNAKATRVPLTDPDSYIQPNKDGGYAPNYTPAVAVNGANGAIMHADVVPGAEEGVIALPAVEEAKAITGAAPQRILADGNVLTGKTMQDLEREGIAMYTPTGTDFSDSNPANRPDPSEPVPESQRAKLPHRAELFSQAAFVYDAENDRYYCPWGKVLEPVGNATQIGSRGCRQKYICPGKEGCPFANECVPEKTPVRSVVRDEYQDTRDEIGRCMATPEGRAVYKRRAPVVEVVFARIKQQMGIRQFLLRGLDKVRTEWSWICAAYNLKLLMGLVSGGAKSPGKDEERLRKSRFPRENPVLVVQFGGGRHCEWALHRAA